MNQKEEKKDYLPLIVGLVTWFILMLRVIIRGEMSVIYAVVFTVSLSLVLMVGGVFNLKRLTKKDDGTAVMNDVYNRKVFEFHGMANPFEYAGADKSFFIYLTNRDKCVSMMTDTLIYPLEEIGSSMYNKVLSMGYTNLWVCRRTFLLQSDGQSKGFKTVMNTGQKADFLLLIVGEGDKGSLELVYDGDAKRQYSLDDARQYINSGAIEEGKVYACLGAQLVENHCWH